MSMCVHHWIMEQRIWRTKGKRHVPYQIGRCKHCQETRAFYDGALIPDKQLDRLVAENLAD